MRATRRGFLGAAAGALGAGLAAGCSKRLPRYLVPFAIPPDDSVPGLARFYRSVCRACPAACGLTARVREGRVVKLEGNPEHPISRGALCPRGQAAVEDLYSPERLAAPVASGREVSWDEAGRALAHGLGGALAAGKLVVVLTRPEPGSLGALLRAWLGALGQAPDQLVTFDPMAPAWLAAGVKRAFATDATPVPDLAAARLLLSIGDDFVEDHGSPVERARALADLRAAGGRFVYVGPRMSLTAAAADEWLAPAPGSEVLLVLGLARLALGLAGPEADGSLPASLSARLAPYDAETVVARTGVAAATLRRLAHAVVEQGPSLCLGPGRAVAGAGEAAAALAEAVCVLNAVAGSVGRTLRFLPRPQAPWAGPELSLPELARRAAAGDVGAVIVHHANPLGFGPLFAGLSSALERVPFVAAFANVLDETASRATLALPDHHFLETWSDVSPRPGVTGIQQPVMSPVFSTRAAADTLLAAARTLGKTTGLPDGSFGDAVRQAFSEKDLERGVRVAEVAPVAVTLSADALAAASTAPAALRGPAGGLPLVVAPTLRHLDGLPPRGALLHELPDPLTTVSWSGWVELHPRTAATLGVATGDVVALDAAPGRVELPVYVTPLTGERVVAVPVGHAAPLLGGAGALRFETRVAVAATGKRALMPHQPASRSQHGRDLARHVTPQEPRLPRPPRRLSLYPPVEHPVHRWGMAIDLDRCNGCGACVAACYVENNLPVVGREQVARGRDMAWLAIKAFIDEGAAGPEVSVMPLMCQHCTSAPCEEVCPTAATYHSSEGLNAQIYARCIGTRYCENNCPYSVRRFNFFDWERTPPASLGLNPDVVVRERGVTEKCTLCVQRIRGGEEQARVDGRALRDGEIVTACAATCPARAIVFGDLNDEASQISRWAADGRAYRALEELNTEPGVSYLARRRGGS